MDILKDKNYKVYDYICRYANIPYYYHTLDDKYIYGIGSNFKKDASYTLHTVAATDTLDYLALKYYNNPTYYWVIAYFNDIQDSFIQLSDYYSTIKIPSIVDLKFGGDR